MEDKEIKLTITIEEANTILEALGNLPFKQVFGLIGKIQQQASQQLGENNGQKLSGDKISESVKGMQ